jgi:hypothetical protein
MVASPSRQIVATIWRQIVTGRICVYNKTACSGLHHCLLVFKRRMKHFQRDGLLRKAGDGTRTRDSLLGRNVLLLFGLFPYFIAYRSLESNLPILLSNFSRAGGWYNAA